MVAWSKLERFARWVLSGWGPTLRLSWLVGVGLGVWVVVETVRVG